MRNLSLIECENEVLRKKYATLKAASAALADRVERYTRQECLRSDLLNTKETLKNLLK